MLFGNKALVCKFPHNFQRCLEEALHDSHNHQKTEPTQCRTVSWVPIAFFDRLSIQSQWFIGLVTLVDTNLHIFKSF